MIPSISEIDYAPLADHCGNACFSLRIGCDVDYACFAIWNGALSKQDEITADLAKNFDIIGDFKVHWSERNYNHNIGRLYERVSRPSAFEGYDSKIGPTPFRFLIVRDQTPRYTWKRSVSGIIEPSNEAIVSAKYRYRNLFDKPYQIHSSNNLQELLIQVALILGPGLANKVMTTTDCIKETLHKDLEGADGWDDWEHLFSVLNIACNYLILRNYEGLPDRLQDTDVDFQCDNFQRLASAANVHQDADDRPFKGSMRVGGDEIRVDIRYVGDGYYPAVWQTDMLKRRRLANGFYVPAADDLFFSMLYHAKVQKPSVKPEYREKLGSLAEELRFDWYSQEMIDDDEKCCQFLAGYLRGRQLNYEIPVDSGVYANENIIDGLPQSSVHHSASKIRRRRIKAQARKMLTKARRAVREPRLIAPYVLKRMGLKKST